MIIPKVSRSRFSWMNSLTRIPIQRDSEKRGAGHAGPAFAASCIRLMNTSSSPASMRSQR